MIEGVSNIEYTDSATVYVCPNGHMHPGRGSTVMCPVCGRFFGIVYPEHAIKLLESCKYPERFRDEIGYFDKGKWNKLIMKWRWNDKP